MQFTLTYKSQQKGKSKQKTAIFENRR